MSTGRWTRISYFSDSSNELTGSFLSGHRSPD
jgi:hypothetical protein